MIMPIDRKFTFVATCLEHGHDHDEFDAMVFLAKDAALPDLLDAYYQLCKDRGAEERQLVGITLLRERVVRYQQEHPELVKVADVDNTPEGDSILAPN